MFHQRVRRGTDVRRAAAGAWKITLLPLRGGSLQVIHISVSLPIDKRLQQKKISGFFTARSRCEATLRYDHP